MLDVSVSDPSGIHGYVTVPLQREMRRRTCIGIGLLGGLVYRPGLGGWPGNTHSAFLLSGSKVTGSGTVQGHHLTVVVMDLVCKAVVLKKLN